MSENRSLEEMAKARAQGYEWGKQAGGEAIQTATFYTMLIRNNVPPDQAAVIAGHYAASLVSNRK